MIPARSACRGLARPTPWRQTAAPRSSAWGALRLPDAASLAAVLAGALLSAELGRALVMWKRRHRIGLVRRACAAVEAGSPRGVQLANFTGALQSVVLGMVLAGVGLLAGSFALALAGRVPVADGRWVALAVLGVGLGHTVTLVEKRGRGLAWLLVTLAGAAAGWALR